MLPRCTQGRPKGVEVTHGGLRDLIHFFVDKMDLGESLLHSSGGSRTASRGSAPPPPPASKNSTLATAASPPLPQAPTTSSALTPPYALTLTCSTSTAALSPAVGSSSLALTATQVRPPLLAPIHVCTCLPAAPALPAVPLLSLVPAPRAVLPASVLPLPPPLPTSTPTQLSTLQPGPFLLSASLQTPPTWLSCAATTASQSWR